MLRLLAVGLPVLASGALHLLAENVPNSSAVLVLVLLVVAAAATGDRIAGLLAALSAALSFDFFLTAPYFQLRIDSAGDLEMTILLFAVGVAVSELAGWGIRSNAAAVQQAGFVRGVLESAALAAGSISFDDALPRVCEAIKQTLGADEVTFEYGDHDTAATVIAPDGSARYRGRTLDASLIGLPSLPHSYAAIPISRHAAQVGYFRIRTTRRVHPSTEQLRVATLLAGQWTNRAETPQSRTRLDPGTRSSVARG